MVEFNPEKRKFLRLTLAVPVGLITGTVMFPVKKMVNTSVEKMTGHSTGNAAIRQLIKEKCRDSQNPEECYKNYQFPIKDKLEGIIMAPIEEELFLRAIPSCALSIIERREDPLGDVISGVEGVRITRRGLIVGSLSSIFSGLCHNITDTGFDTKTIPASQILGGVACWCLQRKLGIMSNILAHATNNFRGLY